MEKIKCIIVDDEPIARRGMRRFIDMHPDLEAIGWACCAEDAEKLLTENEVDLIFLDVDMPGESGIELARRLEGKYMVIFTTAYSDYAIDSYEVEALDYLLKPIRGERFSRAVARALERMEKKGSDSSCASSPMITIKADRRFERIPVERILYIEGLGDYLLIHLPDRRITTRMTFKAISDMLPKHEFLRVNKSYIVNRNKIEAFSSSEIKIGDIMIPVGATYRDNVIMELRGEWI